MTKTACCWCWIGSITARGTPFRKHWITQITGAEPAGARWDRIQHSGNVGQYAAGPRQKTYSDPENGLFARPAADYQADRRRAAPLVAALVRAVEQYRRTLLEAKLAEKVLDYADLEHMTLELLLTPEHERTSLCRTVSARYSAVLVDEYQDTNALQDAIYFALAAPGCF